MLDLVAYIDGIGWWSPGLPDWSSAMRLLRGEGAVPGATAIKPAAAALSPNERRRAPESVQLACEVAAQACAMAARTAAEIPCLFASMHGDIATTDALCATLAEAPLQISPTRFHNSVHNAAVGYWTIATQCHAASSAIAAGPGTFAAGLFEAVIEACADSTAIVFAAHDVAARGPLLDIIDTRAPLGVAFVVTHTRTQRSMACLRIRHEALAAPPPALPAHLAALGASNPVACALPLFLALTQAAPSTIHLPLGTTRRLTIEVLP